MNAYRGYFASIWFEPDDNMFHGMADGLRDVIHFSGASAEELQRAFHDSVDAYLEACAADGIAPEKPYSGKLAFRTSPDHHRLIAEAAARKAISINQFMDEALAEAARRVIADGVQVVRTR
jgi:predicted HicB family RNase H-like nuclease